MTAPAIYDATIPTEHVADLRAAADRVRFHMRSSTESLFEIGRELADAKAKIGEDSFYRWVLAEFDMPKTTAWRVMSVFERYGSNRSTVERLPVSALYELAAPSTPDEVRSEVEARAEAGESVSTAEVKRLKARALEAEKLEQSVRLQQQANARLRERVSELEAEAESAPAPMTIEAVPDLAELEARYGAFVAHWRSLPGVLRERFFAEHATAFSTTRPQGEGSRAAFNGGYSLEQGGADDVARHSGHLDQGGTGEPFDTGDDPVSADLHQAEMDDDDDLPLDTGASGAEDAGGDRAGRGEDRAEAGGGDRAGDRATQAEGEASRRVPQAQGEEEGGGESGGAGNRGAADCGLSETPLFLIHDPEARAREAARRAAEEAA